MAGNRLTIQLTSEQQKQIMDATGRSVNALNINLNSSGTISDADLDGVVGGAGDIVIVKTTDKASTNLF